MDDISLSAASDSPSASAGLLPDVHEALTKEVRIFTRRERLLFHFKACTLYEASLSLQGMYSIYTYDSFQ